MSDWDDMRVGHTFECDLDELLGIETREIAVWPPQPPLEIQITAVDWETETITFGVPITEACAECGTLVHPRYPKHSRCAQCGSSEPTVPVSGVGSVP